MLAHSFRITGYDTGIEQRSHAPQILRAGLFGAIGAAIGLLSFFRSFEHLDAIGTHGLFFLLIYDGLLTEALVGLTFTIGGFHFLLSRALFRESTPDQVRLSLRLTAASLLFAGIYLYFTYPNTSAYLWSENIFDQELWDGGMRVLYTEFIFVMTGVLVVTNALAGLVALSLRGDFFDMDHRRAFALNLIPAVVAFISSLPRNAVRIESLHLYIIAAAALYMLAIALCLHYEYGKLDD